MRTLTGGIFVLVMVVAIAGALSSQGGGSTHPVVTQAEYDRWKKELSNWGRWGKDDQMGALNLITPAKRKQALAVVKDGVSVSLAHEAITEKAVDTPSPYEVTMQGIGGDKITVSYHGSSITHMDALGHIFEAEFGGQAYNGYKPDEAEVMKNRHPRNSIYNVRNGVLTRGVLMDIPRLKGLPYLEPGTPIFVEDLEAWEKKAGVKVTAGDALLIRTGRWARRAALGAWDTGSGPTGKRAGLDASVIPWLRQRDIAVLGTDVPHSVNPDRGPHQGARAAHDFPLVMLGVTLIDNVDLEAAAETAAARNRWEFLLTVAPLPIRGGTGSPVNPIATF